MLIEAVPASMEIAELFSPKGMDKSCNVGLLAGKGVQERLEDNWDVTEKVDAIIVKVVGQHLSLNRCRQSR